MSQPQVKKALVTGSEGFVGRHLVPKLTAAGYTVCHVDKKLGGNCDVEYLTKSVYAKEKWDVIIHLAVNSRQLDERLICGVDAYQDLELDLAMARYVEANPPNELYLYPTSGATDTPRDPYAWVKLSGEQLGRRLARQGVPVTMLRPFGGYGEDQDKSFPFRAILERALRGERPIKVWGSGDQVRDWIHIDDLSDAFMWAIDRAPFGGQPVDIGTGVGTTFRKLAEMIAREVSPRSPAPVMADESKPGSSWSRIANTGVAGRQGFYTKITLAEGIRRAVAAQREMFVEATD